MYRIQIDRSLCSGYGSCIENAPHVFALDDLGVAVARIERSDAPTVIEAALSCPMCAITILDEEDARAA